MSNHIPDDLSIPPFLSRNTTSASDDEAVPIRVEAYDKINYWRDKLDQTAKLNKRDVYERAAADLSLEAECESNLGAVQAIRDEIYFLGHDHTGLDDDDIQYIMDGAKAKVERPINDRAPRDAVDEPATSSEKLRHAANEKIKNPQSSDRHRSNTARRLKSRNAGGFMAGTICATA